VVWVLSTQTIRYGLPLFAIVCVASGYGFAVFQARSALLRWTASAALCSWLLWSVAFTNYSSRGVWNVVAGKRDPESYLSATVSSYSVMQWINNNLPNDAVIAVYAEPRAFYLERSYFWADPYQNTLLPPDGEPEALLAALKNKGATHILLNQDAVRNFGVGGPPPQFAAIPATNFKTLLEAKDYRGYVLLEIVR
jgi:hypothetical protein